MKQKNIFLFTLVVILCSSPFVNALSVKTLNLNQLIGFSEKICRVTVTESQVVDDTEESGQLVKYYTFKVHECLKGKADPKLIVKQTLSKTLGLPDYKKGQTYLLFLPQASEKTGLVAPVGIWQGQYLLEEKDGKWQVPALREETRLLRDIKKQAESHSMALKALESQKTQDDYEAFKAVIQKLVEEQQ